MSNIRTNLLLCYANRAKALLTHYDGFKLYKDLDILIDCGSVRAFKSGYRVTLKEYCDFLDKYVIGNTSIRYFTLDVIQNEKRSTENYNIMLKEGYKPVPIATIGCSADQVDKYYETSDLIGLGGLAQTRLRKNYTYLDKLMKVVRGRKVHWLAFGIVPALLYYKPYSFDSATWTHVFRSGQFVFCIDRVCKLITIPNKTLTKVLLNSKNTKEKKQWVTLLSNSNIPMQKVIDGSFLHGTTDVYYYSAKEFLRYASCLEKVTGTKYYLVCGQKIQMESLLKVHGDMGRN